MGGRANDIEVSDVTDQDVCIDRFVVSHKLVNFRPITLEEATVRVLAAFFFCFI